ncbi:helix-turn-helix domain-containing protein [Candidatus Saccharibacteria bacterium]|nr:helix-turn-helix domain-containing protein [Candidatus Saccharibacteria bacterium]
MKITQFCPDRMAEIKQLIDSSTDTAVVGMPGVGIATFLIELSKQPYGLMIFIDAHVLPRHTTDDIARALLQKLGQEAGDMSPDEVIRAVVARLQEACKRHERIVISIGGFDQLQAEFDKDFFHTLMTFKGVDKQKIIYLFGVCRRLDSLITNKMIDTDLRFFSSVYYLKPYEPDALRFLLPIYASTATLQHPRLNELIPYSGGNFQFLRLLLASQRQDRPVDDPLIKLAFSNIYNSLSGKQKTLLKQMAQNGSSDKTDEFLQGVGIIVPDGKRYKLFCELFVDCVRVYTQPRLPAKEQKLFRLLKRNIGEIVHKNEIMDVLWPDGSGSEWALNALVYRLRRHPAFQSQQYSIENAKKLGYILTKN